MGQGVTLDVAREIERVARILNEGANYTLSDSTSTFDAVTDEIRASVVATSARGEGVI